MCNTRETEESQAGIEVNPIICRTYEYMRKINALVMLYLIGSKILVGYKTN